MTRTKVLPVMLSIFAALSMAPPVEAWVVAGARGVAVGRYGAGCYHGAYGAVSWNRGIPVAYGNYGAGVVPYGAYGGTAAWNYGSGLAAGYRGPTAWSHGSGYAVDRFGGTASWGGGSGSYHGAYGRSVSWLR